MIYLTPLALPRISISLHLALQPSLLPSCLETRPYRTLTIHLNLILVTSKFRTSTFDVKAGSFGMSFFNSENDIYVFLASSKIGLLPWTQPEHMLQTRYVNVYS